MANYRRLLAEHFSGNDNGPMATVATTESEVWTVAMLAVKYDEFARRYYVKNGEPTDTRYQAGIEPLVSLYGGVPVHEFGPKQLIATREHIVARGNLRNAKFDEQGNLIQPGTPLNRDYVNNLMKALVRMFKWGVTEERVPAGVHDALSKVGGLRKGKDPRVVESRPIKPVPEEHFWPVIAATPPQIATMLQVQRLAGMRPDEVTIMRPCDIDRGRDVWSYRPDSHKLEHHDIDKEILLGPKAQELLTPWLVERGPADYLFSALEVAEANATELEKKRKHPSSKKVGIAKVHPPRDHYDDRGYRQVVIWACRRAGVRPWSPGQLRHNAGTDVRKNYGGVPIGFGVPESLDHRNLRREEQTPIRTTHEGNGVTSDRCGSPRLPEQPALLENPPGLFCLLVQRCPICRRQGISAGRIVECRKKPVHRLLTGEVRAADSARLKSNDLATLAFSPRRRPTRNREWMRGLPPRNTGNLLAA
jgi:integrase